MALRKNDKTKVKGITIAQLTTTLGFLACCSNIKKYTRQSEVLFNDIQDRAWKDLYKEYPPARQVVRILALQIKRADSKANPAVTLKDLLGPLVICCSTLHSAQVG